MKNLKKNQSLHAAQFRLRAQKWEPGQQWPLGSLAGKHLKDAPPALCSCLQRCCGSPHAIPHRTLGPLGHQNDTEVFGVWALWIFSFSFLFLFFALLLENEIFSSFLRNKLVNKFILFCFSFPQSFIFNPIPFRLHSFPLLLPGVAAIGLLSCCRSQQALSTRGLHLLISSCFFCKLVNKLN